MRIWKNKKNGNHYAILAHGIDCTNDRDGTEIVIYSKGDDPQMIFVREAKEFYDKFEVIADIPKPAGAKEGS